MFSILKPDFIYTDVSDDITENDVDVVSDLWTMNGRDVYRGSRDPRYTHANVYWLYDEDLQRVGCTEHSVRDHGVFEVLWFHDSEFATLLQEEGWTIENDLWSSLPETVFNRFVNEEWVTPEKFLEQCLYGPFRIVTPKMLIQRPTVYMCQKCGRKSLQPIPGCSMEQSLLDFPDKAKIVFVDDDLRVHVPPSDSNVFKRLQLGDGLRSLDLMEQVLVQEQEQLEPPPQSALHTQPEQEQSQVQPQRTEEQPPPQSHLRTPEQPSNAVEEKPERT